MGLFVFFACIIVVTFTALKLAEVNLYQPSGFNIHDKPVTCTNCGQYMWSGPHVHSCTESASVDE